jgi:hypothetical protein
MSNTVDYFAVDIPEEKPPEEYHYTQRRAALLEEVLELGTPTAVSRTEAGERYGVTHGQITQDLDAIAECVEQQVGSRATLRTRAMLDRVTRDLLEADDWQARKAAWDVVSDWNDWLGDVGEQERAPNRHEHDVDVAVSGDGYQVIHDADHADDPDDHADETEDESEPDVAFRSTPEAGGEDGES